MGVIDIVYYCFNMEALKDGNSTWGFTFPAKALAAAR